MRIELRGAAVGAGLTAAVPPLTLAVSGGTPAAIAVETDERPMLLSMLLGGRIRPDSGSVTIDGAEDCALLRRRTALVDTPFVSEAAAGVSLGTAVAEELAFGDLPSSRAAVRSFLSAHGLSAYQKVAVRALPAADRIRIFTELALQRPGIGAVIITSPERHGGNAADWFGPLTELADRGTCVVVITDSLTRNHLLTLGARDPELVES